MLSNYHLKQSSLPDEEIDKRTEVKRIELTHALEAMPVLSNGGRAAVAVLGCADPRYVPLHREMFAGLLGLPVELTTYDIAIEHLEGAEGVVRHDCTEPFPGGPFDLTFAHVLLKFIETEGQWQVVRNAYDSLKPGGVAVFVMDELDLGPAGERSDDGSWNVSLDMLKERLAADNLEFAEVPVRYGVVLAVRKSKS